MQMQQPRRLYFANDMQAKHLYVELSLNTLDLSGAASNVHMYLSE